MGMATMTGEPIGSDRELQESFDRHMKSIGREGKETAMSEAQPIVRTPDKIELEPNTDAWLKFRHGVIGASDAPVIMRTSPFQDPFSLFLLKTGQKNDKKANAQQQHGHDNEPLARDAYTAQTGNFCAPAMLRMTAWPEWLVTELIVKNLEPGNLTVSCDGYAAKKRLTVEIKCPVEIGDHITAREGHIPDKYYPQIQHNLLVSDAVRCDYVSFFRDETIVIPVGIDRKYCAEELIPRLDEFWGWVKTKKYPIPAKDSVHTFTEPAELEAAARAAASLAMLQEAEKRYNARKADLMKFCHPYAKSIIGDIECIQQYKKGYPVSYDASPSLSFTVRRAKNNGK